jgi:protein TonB
VAFESWSAKHRDWLRLRRLLLSSGLGCVALLSVFVILLKTAPKALAEDVEEEAKIVEVELAKEPEPEPPPPPPPAELRPRQPNPGPRLQKLEAPKTISDAKIEEKEVKPSAAAAGGDPYEKGAGDGSSGAQKTVVEAPSAAPPPPPPKPIIKDAPRPVSETDTPPELLGSAPIPEMPAQAKAVGVEGTVIVKFTVTETGTVTDVKVLKGPPELHAVCIAAVKAMRFKPGHSEDGVARAFTRIKKFKFQLRT